MQEAEPLVKSLGLVLALFATACRTGQFDPFLPFKFDVVPQMTNRVTAMLMRENCESLLGQSDTLPDIAGKVFRMTMDRPRPVDIHRMAISDPTRWINAL